MDTLTFIASLVNSLAWPVMVFLLVIFITVTFENEIGRVIDRIKSFGWGSLRMETELDSIKRLQDLELEISELDDRSRNATIADPRAAVIEAWLRLEWAAYENLEKRGVAVRPRSPMDTIRALTSEGLLSDNLLEMTEGLRRLRNIAVHELNVSINADNAKEYVASAEYVMAAIRSYEASQ